MSWIRKAHQSFRYGQTEISKTSGVGEVEHRALRNWQINQPIFDGRGSWKKKLTPLEIEWLKDHPVSQLAERLGYVWED